ncbi:MAG TPA: zinc-ribbon domain-containing protein [Acetobacteraceae bacterium]|nr:zinc-ribbon domain-containing protein [Acetobacteraceae bacterium]
MTYCSKCGSENTDAAKFCARCGNALGSTARTRTETATRPPDLQFAASFREPASVAPVPSVAPAPMALGARRYANGKTPWVATLLSLLFPGIGQFYNGDTKKGITMLIVAIILWVPTVGIGVLPVTIWAMIDAYHVAKGEWALW